MTISYLTLPTITIMLDQNFAIDPLLTQLQTSVFSGIDRNDLSTILPKNTDSALSSISELSDLYAFTNSRGKAEPLDLNGSGGSETLRGGNANDRLSGLAGNDILIGGNGDDILLGGTGRDILLGGRGNDLLVDDYDGGDILTGGKGNDIFAVGNWGTPGQNRTPDLITDFEIGTDKIKVGRLGATFDQLTIKNSRQGAIISDGENNSIAILRGIKSEKLTNNSFVFGDANLADRLQTALDKSRAESNTPGATQAFITPDGFTWQGATGVSNLATQTPTKTDDIFNIGSTTKSFTSATVLKLSEAGKLSLDDTLGKWFPDIAANIPEGKDITVRQLLNGSGGIPNYTNDPKFLADVQTDFISGTNKQFQPEELVAYIYGKPRFSPDFTSSTTWTYPNTGILLAGLIIEKATGKSYEQSVREQVIEPLGLKHTFFNGKEQVVGTQARGYDDIFKSNGTIGRDGTLDDTTNFNPSIIFANGGILSSSQDIARFTTALYSGDLLQPNSQKELLTFVSEGEGFNYANTLEYGLGVATFRSSFGTAYGNGGSLTGYRAESRYFVDKGGATLAILNNLNEDLANTIDPQNTKPDSIFPFLKNLQEVLLVS
jgi:D-alanyl-D-alanine carboxypeptidase